MLHITLGDEVEVDPTTDGLARDRVGYRPGMSPLALWDVARGVWRLDARRATQQNYALVTHKGTVVGAAALSGVEASEREDAKWVLRGEPITEGHPVHDRYVGKPSPLGRVQRNPIGYFADEELDGIACLCGCGGFVKSRGRDFLPGHDQRALQARVQTLGGLVPFLEWFDAVTAPWADDAPETEG